MRNFLFINAAVMNYLFMNVADKLLIDVC